MTSAIAVREQPQGGALAMWDAEQIDVIKGLICPGATDQELRLFGQVCQKTGLDPFSRQIYGIMRSQRAQVNGQWKTIEKLSIQTSIDGFRLIAERSGKYGGQVGPFWCGADGVWRDVWLSNEYPCAAKVGVIRTDWTKPLEAVARWDSYVQTFRKDGQEMVGAMWQRMPDVMLAKVAESLALRRAFPAELSGLYTSDEMHQADNESRPTSAAPTPIRGEIIDGPSSCDTEHFNKAWHAAVKGSRFEDDETRHKYLAYYSGGKFESLSGFLQAATEGEAAGLISSIENRIAAEARKARASLEAEVRDIVAAANAQGSSSFTVPDPIDQCSDSELRGFIALVQESMGDDLEDLPV